MTMQPEATSKRFPSQLASTILEEKHMVSIIMYLAENDGCLKTDVYSGVARNSRMPEKLGMLEDAGLIEQKAKGLRTVRLELTDLGKKVCEELITIENLLNGGV